MKKSAIAILFIVCFWSFVPVSAKGQTPGSLAFSVTTTEPAGGYSGVHVIALWIEDTHGNFIKTKIRYAQSRIQYLDQWIASSAYNVTDAVTGATLTTHGTLSFIWNGTDVAGNVVADKPYKLWIQMADRNLSGATFSILFNKDTSDQHLTPSDNGNFTNMTLDWTNTAGIEDMEHMKLVLSCTPNPFSREAVLAYDLPANADVTITLHDGSGRTVAVLFDGNQAAGKQFIRFEAKNALLKPGVYFIKVYTGSATGTKRIVLAP
jgi:hypothetical protein